MSYNDPSGPWQYYTSRELELPVDNAVGISEITKTTVVAAEQPDYGHEEREHKHREHMGELGAIAPGAFALHEKHKAEKDPEHAHKHKLEEEIAAEKKEAKEEEKEAEAVETKPRNLF